MREFVEALIGVGYHNKRLLGRALGFTLLLLAGCDTSVYRTQPSAPPPSPPQAPVTKIYFYPNQGQTEQQQDRDRYECYLWAVEKSGFDPSQASLAPHQRVEVIPQPVPGASAAAGAVTGAIAGSVLAEPRHRDEGLVLGAITGALLGAAADAERTEQAAKMEQQLNAQQDARLEQRARDYRRAMTACLEGRGYTVR